jgi:signal transduction histidine kinase
MRLLTKNIILLLVVTLLVFSGGIFLFYHQLKEIMEEETVEELYAQKEKIENYVQLQNEFPSLVLGKFNYAETTVKQENKLEDVLVYVDEEDEKQLFKQLNFQLSLNGKLYSCSISKSLFESDDLIETILYSFAITLGLLVFLFVVFNYIFSGIIWRPFFKTIKYITDYDVEKRQPLSLPDTGTKEFRQLHEALNKMTDKITRDIESLKAFTENASHELQTPLAIIKNKVELLVQDENLTAEQVDLLTTINKTAVRLSKINQTLLLLTKIENGQFNKNEVVDISILLNEKIEHFIELASIKGIKMNISTANCTLAIDPALVEIVFSNLISNALKYTAPKEEIYITLEQNVFSVSNPGKPLAADNEKIFDRFYKENSHADSVGLGLALVKQISLVCGHSVEYEYKNQSHIFRYNFNYRVSSDL